MTDPQPNPLTADELKQRMRDYAWTVSLCHGPGSARELNGDHLLFPAKPDSSMKDKQP